MLGTCTPFSISASHARETARSELFFSRAILWVCSSTSRTVRPRLSRSRLSLAPADTSLLSIAAHINVCTSDENLILKVATSAKVRAVPAQKNVKRFLPQAFLSDRRRSSLPSVHDGKPRTAEIGVEGGALSTQPNDVAKGEVFEPGQSAHGLSEKERDLGIPLDRYLVVPPFANGFERPVRLRNGVEAEVVGRVTALVRRL
jgi:hypothetical protein